MHMHMSYKYIWKLANSVVFPPRVRRQIVQLPTGVL